MEFDQLLVGLKSSLEAVARRVATGRCPAFMDHEDAVAEMVSHLYGKWKAGCYDNCTESYILQDCSFYLRNFLRSLRGIDAVPLDAEVEDRLETRSAGTRRKEQDKLTARLTVTEMRANGLTPRQKEVLNLRMRGLSVRETARRMAISHVRVLAIQKAVAAAWRDKEK